jgi:hypothetical protein
MVPREFSTRIQRWQVRFNLGESPATERGDGLRLRKVLLLTPITRRQRAVKPAVPERTRRLAHLGALHIPTTSFLDHVAFDPARRRIAGQDLRL